MEECAYLTKEGDHTRCRVTGTKLEGVHLSDEAERVFDEDREKEAADEKDRAHEYNSTTGRFGRVAGVMTSKATVESVNTQPGAAKRKAQDKDEQKQQQAASDSVLRKQLTVEAMTQRVACVWSEICDTYVLDALKRDRLLCKRYERALVALWQVYQIARAQWPQSYSDIAPQNFVVAIVADALSRSMHIEGVMKIAAVSHLVKFPLPVAGQTTFDIRLSKNNRSVNLPLNDSDPRKPRHQVVSDLAIRSEVLHKFESASCLKVTVQRAGRGAQRLHKAINAVLLNHQLGTLYHSLIPALLMQ